MQEAKSHWRVLVVEDEAKVARALREGLERENYEVVVAPTGEEGFFLVNAEEFDLVILELMLPGRDGLQVLATLRKRGLQTPVLILTARDAIEDRVEGLDKGGDDYLVKPFAFPELLARVRALLRRGRTEQAFQLRIADLEMDATTRKARRRGQQLDQGPGIPGDHRPYVFDRFYRVDKARTREWGGAGLGLSITRWAVEAHGGAITLKSEEGHGSTFRIVLPVLKNSPASQSKGGSQ